MFAIQQVEEAIRVTFEEMAFLDVVPGPPVHDPAPREEGPVLFLSYTQPCSGSFALFLPKAIKFQIAEAIYSEDWTKLSAVQIDDSLLELMNVLVGRLLTGRFGVSSTYAMGLPTVLYDPPGQFIGQNRRDFSFHVDQYEVTLVWYEVTP